MRHFLPMLVLSGLLLGQPLRTVGQAHQALPVPTKTLSASQPAKLAQPATPPALAWVWYSPVAISSPATLARSTPPTQPSAAYCDYQANAQGQVSLANEERGVAHVATARPPRPPLLLRLRYQEPPAGPSLLGPGQQAARQRVADTLARRLSASQADGLNLAVQLRLPSAAGPTGLLLPGERQRLLRILDSRRVALNTDSVKLKREALALQTQKVPTGKQARYQQLLHAHRQRTLAFQERRAIYRRSLRAVRQHQLPSELSALVIRPPVSNELGLRSLVTLLRERLAQYRADARLLVTLPVRDTIRQYARIFASLAPAVNSFVLAMPAGQAAGQPAFWQAMARHYYAAGIPAGRLNIEHPHAGPPPALAVQATPPLRPARLPTSTALPVATGHLPNWAHLGLFATALLLGFACLGLLLGALRRAPAIVPFRRRLLRVGGLLGGGLLLLGGYGYLLEPAVQLPLQYTCLAGLVLIGAGLLYHRVRQPSQLP